MRGALSFLRRDWQVTAELFLAWSWERGAFLVGAFILMLSVVAVAAQIAAAS